MALEYEYYCEANGRCLSVRHGMSEEIRTWAELCARSDEALGDTDPQAKVSRVISGGILSLARRVSKQTPDTGLDPVLHGSDSCTPCACGKKTKHECGTD